MQKIITLLVLGCIIYGCIFSAKYPTLETTFRVLDARTILEPKLSLGLLDGLHNGFVALGNTVASYGNFLASSVSSFFRLAGEDHGFGGIRWLGFIAVAILTRIVMAVLLVFLHFAFYVALLFQLFFVATTPLYHLGFLVATGVTWLLIAILSNSADETTGGTDAQG